MCWTSFLEARVSAVGVCLTAISAHQCTQQACFSPHISVPLAHNQIASCSAETHHHTCCRGQGGQHQAQPLHCRAAGTPGGPHARPGSHPAAVSEPHLLMCWSPASWSEALNSLTCGSPALAFCCTSDPSTCSVGAVQAYWQLPRVAGELAEPCPCGRG